MDIILTFQLGEKVCESYGVINFSTFQHLCFCADKSSCSKKYIFNLKISQVLVVLKA